MRTQVEFVSLERGLLLDEAILGNADAGQGPRRAPSPRTTTVPSRARSIAPAQGTIVTTGDFQVPSRIDGSFSFGQ